MRGLPDTCTTYVHIYMYNSDQLMIYSQEQQYKDKAIKDLQAMNRDLMICHHICYVLRMVRH